MSVQSFEVARSDKMYVYVHRDKWARIVGIYIFLIKKIKKGPVYILTFSLNFQLFCRNVLISFKLSIFTWN